MNIFNLSGYFTVMDGNKVLWVYLMGFWFIHTSIALKITSLEVPKSAWDAVKLNCKYDLEEGTLYAVKWYKDYSEFFRCTADGGVQQFPLKDISIYHTGRSQIGSCFFELTALTAKSGGEYTCEVSLDYPTFQIVSKSAYLEVIEPSRIIQQEKTTTEDITIPLAGSKGCIHISRTRGSSLLMVFVIYAFYQ